MVNSIFQNFSSGEGSQKVIGRSDLPIYKSLMEWSQNFIPYPQGPAVFRPGSVYVHTTRRNNFAILMPFFFNDQQAYLIEATAGFFRFYKEEGIITLPDKTITNITQANPGVITSASHGYSNGDEVFIYNVGGMTELNGRSFVVANATTNTFTLKTFDDSAQINTTGFGAYTSGGVANKIYEIATPYSTEDLIHLQSAQNADTRYIVVRTQAPRKLTRTTETNWSLSTFSRTNDPFTGAGNWPGAITFTSDGALIYGGTNNHPERLWKSRTPDDTGGSRYDDFTTSSSPTATHAAVFNLAPLHGKVDSIRWLANTDKFLVAGTYGSVRRIYGSREELAVTPLDVNARSANAFGVAPITPFPNGVQLLYVQRGGFSLRSLEYDYQIDGYQTLDKNLISDHIVNSGIVQIANQAGNPEILWACRNDGALIGLTYNDKENKYGWHRHKIGGTEAKVEWIESLPREQNIDLLWMVVSREVDGNTYRYVEYLNDQIKYPELLDFYTGPDPANKTGDKLKYLNALFEKQKTAIHCDSAIMYDGAAIGVAADATVTPGAGAATINTTGVVFSSNNAVFTSSMVGRQIWKQYDTKGIGGGRARIDEYISSTEVHCTILAPFDTLDAIAPGNWFLTTAHLSGLWHLEGETVKVVKDGAIHPDRIVADGQMTLQSQGSMIVVGLPYLGLIKSMPVDQGGLSGPAVSKIKRFTHFVLRFTNTNRCLAGTDPYTPDRVDFRTTGDITGRPVPLFTGIKKVRVNDGHAMEKPFYIVQDEPLPCTIVSVEPYGETTDE